MFNLFKKKSQAEIETELMLNAFKKIAKEINSNKGLYLEVCIDFVKFMPTNDLLKSIGLIWADDCPHPKNHIMLASLMLLGAVQKGMIKDEDGYYIDIAKTAFQMSSLILTTDEIKPLLKDPELAVSTRDELILKAQQSWNDWLAADPELLRKISEF